MKKAIFYTILITYISCGGFKTISVDIDPITKTFSHDGAQNELYVRANNWMVENFVSAKSVIQFTDKESGTVSGRFLMHDNSRKSTNGATILNDEIYAIIKVVVKDNGSKITIIPESFIDWENPNINKKYRYTREKAAVQMETLISSFDTYMKKVDDGW